MEQAKATQKQTGWDLRQICRLREEALALGAFRAEIIHTEAIVTDASFRQLCEANACGNYGKNHMCPPNAGDITVLMEKIRQYDRALVYQTVWNLEDSYDFEGMMEAGKRHNDLMQKLREKTREESCPEPLHLGAGGCRVCEVCAARTQEPCRFPDKAVASLETYGIDVSQLAKASGMRYTNGKDTVTYFGGIFFTLLPEADG